MTILHPVGRIENIFFPSISLDPVCRPGSILLSSSLPRASFSVGQGNWLRVRHVPHNIPNDLENLDHLYNSGPDNIFDTLITGTLIFRLIHIRHRPLSIRIQLLQ